jgi:hypothetical protein
MERSADPASAYRQHPDWRRLGHNVHAVVDTQHHLIVAPRTMRIRRQTAEHPFGTIKAFQA